MDDGEILILILGFIVALIAMAFNAQTAMHRMYFRGNPGPGLVRLAILLSLAWIWTVCLVWADESVRGIYIFFYLVLGYAAVKLFGQTLGRRVLGIRYRVDVLERRNVPAALVLATFILATGLIFGGSLWGEADPDGEDEGGWWIVWAFFLLGWGFLVAAIRIFMRRERRFGALRGPGFRGIRDPADARATALFLLAAAVTLTDAVAGDFWGWRHGLLTFGVLAGLLIAHEIFAGIAKAGAGGPADAHGAGAAGSSGGVAPVGRPAGARATEGLVYLFLGLAAWGVNRILDAMWGGG